MRRAAQISSGAHRRAMERTRPGWFEYQVEAELLHEFLRHGAQAVAYPSIVAGGPNACVLHYRDNNRQLQDGDLLLIDAGCEFQGYASDITRTFPVSGRFSRAAEGRLRARARRAARLHGRGEAGAPSSTTTTRSPSACSRRDSSTSACATAPSTR